MVEISTRTGDLLGKLGVNTEALAKRLGELSDSSLSALRGLRLAYGNEALEANKFGKSIADGRINLPPFGYVQPPQAALPQLKRYVERSYFQKRELKHPSAQDPFRALFNPRSMRAAKLARLVQTNEAVRRAFERVAGGTVVRDGRTDATLSLLPNTGSAKSAVASTSSAMTGSLPQPPPPQKIYDLLMAMDSAVMKQAASIRPGNKSYVAEFGKGGLLGSDSEYQNKSWSEEEEEDEEEGSGRVFRAFSAGATPMQTIFDAPQDSVDAQTLRLKRLMDRRDQMYDIINKTFDKFNQSAKVAIDNSRG
jgi:hypothetical protein